MANMSYCRFQNTLHDLRECLEALRNEDVLSEDERLAKERLLETCVEVVGEFSEEYVVEQK